MSLHPSDLRETVDIVSPERLHAFSDAIFATAATFLVIPLRKFDMKRFQSAEERLDEYLLEKTQQFVVFLLGFLVICSVWESHIIRFKLIPKVDDFIVCLSLISLLFTTFLPFTVALEGNYGGHESTIILNCAMLLALEVIEFIILVYAFKTKNVVAPEETHIKPIFVYSKILFNCSLFVLAAVFSTATYILSWVLIICVILTPFIRKRLLKFITRKIVSEDVTHYDDIFAGRVDKERIEMFSDAAMGIVATLLILDLTTEDFPKPDQVKAEGIMRAVEGMWRGILSCIATYLSVAVLWFIHHSVLHHLKLFTNVMVVLNNTFLTFLGAVPFVSTLIGQFANEGSPNGTTAVRIQSTVLFCASLANCTLYVAALWNQEECLEVWAVPSPHRSARSTKLHRYLMLKISIVPFASLLVFLISLSSDSATYIAYHASTVLIPVSFLVLKLSFKYGRCEDTRESTDTDSNPIIDAEVIHCCDKLNDGVDNPALVDTACPETVNNT